jgi:hypothetical protein
MAVYALRIFIASTAFAARREAFAWLTPGFAVWTIPSPYPESSGA